MLTVMVMLPGVPAAQVALKVALEPRKADGVGWLPGMVKSKQADSVEPCLTFWSPFIACVFVTSGVVTAGQGDAVGEVRNGLYATTLSWSMIASPVPPRFEAIVGPDDLPHQLFLASSEPGATGV